MAAVILDVDGTLVDSNDAHAHAWVEAFAEAGITVDYDAVRRCIGMGGDKLMPAVFGHRREHAARQAHRRAARRDLQDDVPAGRASHAWSARVARALHRGWLRALGRQFRG